MAERPSKSPYSQHPSFATEEASLTTLKERTGKSLAEWVALVQKEGPPTEKERRAWLKEQGLTTNYTWWIAERAEGRGSAEDYDPEAYIESMFAGKETIRPLYDELLRLGLALGPDVKVCPCQTIVPLYRRHVFAQLKPSTRTRLDLGLCLWDDPFGGRLLDSGGKAKGDRISHRVAITSLADLDEEVKGWLQRAYELDIEEEDQARQARKKNTPPVVPADFILALEQAPGARAAFERLPPSHRREYVKAIEEAKKAETRARRIAQAVQKLGGGPA
jgi:hypothetical protein